jgi:hypothetical protein
VDPRNNNHRHTTWTSKGNKASVMPSKKARAKAKKAAAARAPPPAPAKALAGPGQDDLARSKKADLRAARRLARNYRNGSDTVSRLDDQRRRAMMEALTQGQATYMEHHASKVKQPIATKDRLRRKLAVRRGEDYDPDGLALAEKVVQDAWCAVDGA